MNKTGIILSVLALIVSGCGQTAKKQTETTIQSMTDNIVANDYKDSIVANTKQDGISDFSDFTEPPIPEPPMLIVLEIPKYVKRQRQQRIIPSKKIIVEISDTIPVDAEIYYYSPRMENENYSYQKELGSGNNFLGITDYQNREMISVPDTIEHGAKLMLHAVGYELLELSMESVIDKGHITVQFIPKIYRSTAVLNETIYRDTISVIDVENLHETPPKVFYGECLPIWDDDGINHGDPYCAFACMGCYPIFEFSQYGRYKELTELYLALKSGEDCSLLILVDKHIVQEVEIIGFTNKVLESYRENLLGERIRDGRRFQYLLTLETR